jgi:hypothetical protein
MSALTANQIISEALTLAGNPSLTTIAQEWLNNILDRLYEDFRWPFLQKIATGNVDSSNALPADFSDLWNREGLKVIDTTGNMTSLNVIQADQYDLLTNPSLPGAPTDALFDLNTLTWAPYPLPNTPFTYSLRYKYKPARVTNFDAVVTFPNDALLVQAVYVRALQHEDDARYDVESIVLLNMTKAYLRSFNVSPLKGRNLSLSSRVFFAHGNWR